MSPCDAGHETPKGCEVQGFEASTQSLIWSLGIGRSFNPRPIPVPASPHQERPRVLEPPIESSIHPNLSNRQVNPLFPSYDSFEGVVFHAIALTQNQHITRIE